MRPQPDHGEQTYVGYGRLEGKVALVTGADTPLGRAGQPAEVAPAFVSLASPADSSYIVRDNRRRHRR